MNWCKVIILVIVLATAAGLGAAATQTAAPPPANKPARPSAVARPAAAQPAKPLDPAVGVGGLQVRRQQFDTGRQSGTRYQTDLTPRQDLYLYGGSSTPGERRPGDTPGTPVDQTRPAGTTFGGGVGIRF